MTVPLVVLATGAALVGFLGVPHVLGGHDLLGHYLEPVLSRAPVPHAEAAASGAAMSVEAALMVLAIAIAVLGVVIAHRFYVANPALPGVVAGRFPVLYRRLVALLGIDAFYEKRIVAPLRGFAERVLAQRLDTRLIDAFVNGCGGVARRMARAVAIAQDGSIQNYLTWMVLGTLLLLLTLLA
jgi:NADH-quinone oxidoreductase subunit L